MENAKEKSKNIKQKTKLIIILAVEFVAITLVLLLIFFAGKKTHTVTFDLNGGILISGDLEQRIVQGQNAHPPSVAKYGHYLRGWSGSYKSVTRDVTVKAIWEYETSPGIEYYFPENTNYCEISGSFKEIQGEVFIGSYYNDRQVLGIQAGAFKDRTGITAVYLLDGILAIESEAFAGCTSLEVIDIPSTVVRIGKGAFAGCENLKELILPESLKVIEEGAFQGCTSLSSVKFYHCTELDDLIAPGDTSSAEKPSSNMGVESIGAYAFSGCESLAEIVLPESVKEIGKNTFDTPNMTIKLYISEEDLPLEYVEGWHSEDANLIFDYDPTEESDEEEKNDKDKKDNNLWGNKT